MDKKKEIKNQPTDWSQRFIEMHEQGMTYSKIAEECGVTHQTVRKYVDEHTGKKKREYHRKILNCRTGQPFTPKENVKVLRLNSDIKDLKEELKSIQKLYKAGQSEISKLKIENTTLKTQVKKYEQEHKLYGEELQKLTDEKTKSLLTIQKMKSEGVETKALQAKYVNDHLTKLEKAGYKLVGLDKHGDTAEFPFSQFMY